MTIMSASILGIKILIVQHNLAKIAQQDAWISMIVGGLVALAFGLLIMYPLTRMLPDSDYPEMHLLTFGNVLGRIILMPSIVMIILDTGLSARIFVNVLKVFLLDKTPNYILIIVIIMAVVSVSKRGINALGTSIDFMFPVFILPMLIIIVLSYKILDIDNLKPVLYKNTINVLRGGITALGSLIGIINILFYTCYVEDKKKAFNWIMAGLLIPITIFVILTTTVIMAFGSDFVTYMAYPPLMLSKAIEFPVTLMERLETLLLTVWIPGVFAYLSVYTFASIRNIKVMFNIKEKYTKHIGYVLSIILIITAVYPENLDKVLNNLTFLQNAGLVSLMVKIPLMVVINLIKRRKSRK